MGRFYLLDFKNIAITDYFFNLLNLKDILYDYTKIKKQQHIFCAVAIGMNILSVKFKKEDHLLHPKLYLLLPMPQGYLQQGYKMPEQPG